MNLKLAFESSLPDYAKSPPIECAVFSWGGNEDGQLGYQGEESASAPRVLEALLGYKLRGRAMGANPLVAGSRNSLAISNDGTVWTWGWNTRKTLGRGTSTGAPDRQTVELNGVSIVQAAIGGWHCLAVDSEGRVYAWGGNEYKQCALDIPTRDVAVPTQIMSHLQVKQVACGGMHSLALTTTGDVWIWGEPWGDFSMSQDRALRPIRNSNDIVMVLLLHLHLELTEIKIAAGAFHNMALDKNGKVFTWGINDYGQLGNGSTKYQTTPTRVVDMDDITVVDISAGGWHSVAVTIAGGLYIWGRGEYGRLGLGDPGGTSRLRPTYMKNLERHRVVQASAGGTHTMCLTSEGTMFIWGRGSFCRLGVRESEEDSYDPRPVILPGGAHRWTVIAIACGGRHNLCLALPSSASRSHDPTIEDSDADNEVSGGTYLAGNRHFDSSLMSLQTLYIQNATNVAASRKLPGRLRGRLLQTPQGQRLVVKSRARTSSTALKRQRNVKITAVASNSRAPALEFSTVTETTPIGTPVPCGYEKVKILRPGDLKKGRIIVVGDVHGCYDEFIQLLDACKFDEKKDNLIMAGDLVNKGPDSLKVIKKAMKLKAVVVRGNHEDNALEAYYAQARGEEILEKYEWVKNLKKKQISYLESLPFAVRIPSHKLIVVHAGLIPGTEIEHQDMFAMYRMRDVRKCAIRDSWIPLERGISESIPWASQWKGPEHVIFGHDSSRRLQFHPFATGIDTGAVQGDHLSACVLPPAGNIPDPKAPAFRENLGMKIISISVDGPRKVLYPSPPEEAAKNLMASVTSMHNLCLDMYSSLEEGERTEAALT